MKQRRWTDDWILRDQGALYWIMNNPDNHYHLRNRNMREGLSTHTQTYTKLITQESATVGRVANVWWDVFHNLIEILSRWWVEEGIQQVHDEIPENMATCPEHNTSESKDLSTDGYLDPQANTWGHACSLTDCSCSCWAWALMTGGPGYKHGLVIICISITKVGLRLSLACSSGASGSWQNSDCDEQEPSSSELDHDNRAYDVCHLASCTVSHWISSQETSCFSLQSSDWCTLALIGRTLFGHASTSFHRCPSKSLTLSLSRKTRSKIDSQTFVRPRANKYSNYGRLSGLHSYITLG